MEKASIEVVRGRVLLVLMLVVFILRESEVVLLLLLLLLVLLSLMVSRLEGETLTVDAVEKSRTMEAMTRRRCDEEGIRVLWLIICIAFSLFCFSRKIRVWGGLS